LMKCHVLGIFGRCVEIMIGKWELGSDFAWWRIWPAVVTLFLPLAICFGVYGLSVDYMIQGAGWETLQKFKLNDDELDRFARDVCGRIQFGIVSGLLRIGALAATVLAVFVFARRIGLKAAIWLAGVLTIVCVGLYFVMPFLDKLLKPLSSYQLGQIRAIIDDVHNAGKPHGIDVADAKGGIGFNMLVSRVGGINLLVAFAAVALRATSNERSPADLQGRMRDLERITLVSATFLVILTAVNKTLIDWPQVVLIVDHQKSYAYLGGAIATYWGMFVALLLMSALVPAFLSLRFDIREAAEATSPQDREGANRWMKDNNLEFDVKSGIGAAIATVAPILTVPGIDLVSKLLH
jgi:hypothetical protein